MERKKLIFFVNDQKFELEKADPDQTLVYFLRANGYTGTKVGCLEGVCGSCAVVIGKWDIEANKAIYFSANACLIPLFYVDLCFVITVQGIGSTEKMHPIQERLARGHGSQCGYCSPGFVMAMYALLRNKPKPTEGEIRQALRGNICRCTGYRPIIEAFNTFSDKNIGLCQNCPCSTNGKKCCQQKENENISNGPTKDFDVGLTKWENFKKYDPTQELIFPPELIQIVQKLDSHELLILDGNFTKVYVPRNLKQAQEIIKKEKSKKIYHVSSGQTLRMDLAESSNTDKTIWIAYNKTLELRQIQANKNKILIGAVLSITEVKNIIENSGIFLLRPLVWLFDQFTSMHVRNVATWAGSLLSGIGDFPSISLALSLKIYLHNFDTGEGSILKVTPEFFEKIPSIFNGNTIITHGEFNLENIEAIRTAKFDPIPRSLINLVEAKFKDGSIRTVLNGFEKGPILVRNTELDKIHVSIEYFYFLKNDIFRRLEISQEKLEQLPSLINLAKKPKLNFEPKFESLQLFDQVPDKEGVFGSVGRPLAHQYADRHTTGSAKYTGDLVPRIKNLLHLALVTSEEAHAEILKVDPSGALKLKGVVSYIDINDIPSKGTNTPGVHPLSVPTEDTPIFADKVVICYGQTIGAIVAETVEIARKAAKLVKVEYRPLKPIVTIQDAIEANSFLMPDPIKFQMGNEPEFSKCAYVVEGDVYLPGQQHVYMETQSAIAIPEEDNEWTIFTATQDMTNAQLHSSLVLGIGKHKINIRVKRIGGGFGGKAGMQCGRARFPALVAAYKLKRPVSCHFTRHEDFINTGGRHPAFGKYKLGCDSNGKFVAGEFDVYTNCGYSLDYSIWVTQLMAATGDGPLHIPNLKYTAYPCKTNTASNTAMRGFGQPQSTFFLEYAVDHLARKMGILPEKLRELNHAVEGQQRIDGHIIYHDCLPTSWEECKKFAQYEKLRQEIADFNKNSSTIKRGISMSSIRYGLLHSGKMMEQAFVLVQIYLDGTIGVSIGGIEMGQGLNIKCLQVVSQVLNVPIEKITMIEAATDKTANPTVTGGSQGSDVYGNAIKQACEKLSAGLDPIRKEFPEKTWEEIIGVAFQRAVPLSVGHHGVIPRKENNAPDIGNVYNVTGATVVIAEIDITTGEHKLKNVDIVMDTGNSLNPAVDIGQIEGSFMQMYGHMVLEQVIWDDQGRLLTDTLRNYRLPTAVNVPESFRVMLLKQPNSFKGAVYSSKVTTL